MKIISVAVVVLLSTFGMVESSDDSFALVSALISAPSFVPEEELYTHIAGGYFSSYDMKTGQVKKTVRIELPVLENAKPLCDSKGLGSIKIVLKSLMYSSRFVYIPEGELLLKNSLGEIEAFSLKKLDYVQIVGCDIPAYRLIAKDSDNRVVTLISTSIGTEIPTLVGTLYIQCVTGLECYSVVICGRNNIDQENHLCKKIEKVSFFENKSDLLSYGEHTTTDEEALTEKAFDKAKSFLQRIGI